MSIDNMKVFIKCPDCGHVTTRFDYHENTSSERYEYFAVLNIGAPCNHIWLNSGSMVPVFSCENCGKKFEYDYLFDHGFVCVEDIDVYKRILINGLANYCKEKCFWFSEYDPDVSEQPALDRLIKMKPEDQDFRRIKNHYQMIRVEGAGYLTKLETGCLRVTKDMVRLPSCLKKVYLRNGVQIVGEQAFQHCRALSDIFLPETVTEIENEAFADSALKTIHMSDNIIRIGSLAFSHCEQLKNPWIPAKLETIGDGAFLGCNQITEMILASGIEHIGIDAFKDCSQLTIKCYAGSVAHQYACKNGIPFILLGSNP